jgi:hypothetical protein
VKLAARLEDTQNLFEGMGAVIAGQVVQDEAGEDAVEGAVGEGEDGGRPVNQPDVQSSARNLAPGNFQYGRVAVQSDDFAVAASLFNQDGERGRPAADVPAPGDLFPARPA